MILSRQILADAYIREPSDEQTLVDFNAGKKVIVFLWSNNIGGVTAQDDYQHSMVVIDYKLDKDDILDWKSVCNSKNGCSLLTKA